MCKFYGYIRVSSVDQNEERQRIELNKWGIPTKNLYVDKVSGKDFNRPQYQNLRSKLKEHDVLVLKSLDRLGRNYKSILEEWTYLVKQKQIDIVIIDMPILDTRNNKDLIGTLISDIVLQLLSYVAQVERENIRQRQAEGIAAAKARGVHLGRSADPIPCEFYHIYDLWQQKAFTASEAAEKMRITKNQFCWMVRKYRKSMIMAEKNMDI